MRQALIALAFIATTVHAQWQMQDSGTTASLRGIHNVGNGVAWASGTDGTVLKTEDGGKHWQHCAMPPDAEKLDFRGVQAFDAKTAIVMSSGKGDLSRLYKTTDGCSTWKLVFTNPDKEGFWDAIKFSREFGTRSVGYLLGDPVDGKFVLFFSNDGGWKWERDVIAPSIKDGGAFAASNSSLVMWGSFPRLLGGGGDGSPIFKAGLRSLAPDYFERTWTGHPSQLKSGSAGAGVFAIEPAVEWNMTGKGKGGRDPKHQLAVAVGGDYQKPTSANGVASFTADDGETWIPSQIPPNGYRSAVAYDAPSKAWITVGPNGTDISLDDGKNWHPLTPSPTDIPDADKNWNALSLPFVVGPKGRIGLLEPTVLKAMETK